MPRAVRCSMCGYTGHAWQHDGQCPMRDAMDKQERSEAAKKGWEIRRQLESGRFEFVCTSCEAAGRSGCATPFKSDTQMACAEGRKLGVKPKWDLKERT